MDIQSIYFLPLQHQWKWFFYHFSFYTREMKSGIGKNLNGTWQLAWLMNKLNWKLQIVSSKLSICFGTLHHITEFQFVCTMWLKISPYVIRDHAGGNEELAQLVKGLTVCGGDDRIGALNKKVGHRDQMKVLYSINLKFLSETTKLEIKYIFKKFVIMMCHAWEVKMFDYCPWCVNGVLG